VKNVPIAISPRAAADLRQLLEQAQRINDRLNIYVEAIGAALDVAPGWRFDVQSMAFLPPAKSPEIPGLSPEYVERHESVFCNTTTPAEVPPLPVPDLNEQPEE
jgi:hypothetical protein